VKLIVAIIKPFKLEEVRQALTDVGIFGMTVSEVKGFGRQSGHTEVYRGAEYTVQYVPKIRIEVAVNADLEEAALSAITDAAKTGKIGDGKLFVMDLQSVTRVRTGERDEEAL
jgi:nitrogen regulatory protein PII